MKLLSSTILAALSQMLLLSPGQAAAATTTAATTAQNPHFAVPAKSQRNLLAKSQWTELGSPIAMGKSGSDEMLAVEDLIGLGYCVSSSKDGKIVAVGAPYDNNNKGLVGVYKYDEKLRVWVMMGRELKGEGRGYHFGFDVALSHNGIVLVVAAPRALDGRGLVAVYRYDGAGNDWEQIGADIEGEHSSEEFGTSIACSLDGNLIAVGAPRASSRPGAVRVFQFNGGERTEGNIWEQVGNEILGESDNDRAGHSVDILSHNGDTFVAVGALMDLYTEGSVAVFKYNDNVWDQFGVRVDGDEFGTEFGRSVSLGHDGEYLVLAVGFPGPGMNEFSKVKSGAQVYSISAVGEWDFYGQMIFPLEENDNTGYKVSLSYDGQTLAVSSPEYGDVGNGLIHIYYKGEGNHEYDEIGKGIVGSENDELGFALCVSRDGKVVTAATPDAQYVSTFIIGSSSDRLSPNSMSAMAIVSLTFLIVCSIALLSLAIFKVVVLVRSRKTTTFSSIPTGNNEYEINDSRSAFPVTRNQSASHVIGDPDSDDDGSEVSYDEDEDDYETHLGKITRDII